ncbi:MAG: hypothetical protein AAF483_22610 [Planctomycetota bacterium]
MLKGLFLTEHLLYVIFSFYGLQFLFFASMPPTTWRALSLVQLMRLLAYGAFFAIAMVIIVAITCFN